MKPVLLMILDGFGLYKDYPGNAISLAKTENLDKLYETCPHTEIYASEKWVGLPMGQMGNSEVGHLNIGAGRVVFQDLTRIGNDIDNGNFYHNQMFLKAVENAKKNNSSLHLMGLVSKGGVHSHFKHLLALIDLAKKEGLKKVYIHVITDGRDVSPDASLEDVKELEDYLKKVGVGKIADISGRYYAMDRDKRWERIKKYFDLVTEKYDNSNPNALDAIKSSYDNGVTDEFIKPVEIDCEGKIKDGDSLIFFNFRPDRARQIARALVDENFDGFPRKEKNIFLVTMTQYDDTIPHTNIAYPENRPTNTLGEILEKNHLRQLRIAETEKYAHVTFFFNGGREVMFKGEDRILVQSPKVATYDLKPEMSAPEITENLIEKLRENIYDCIILNFANPDMVGHTGVIPAAIKAVETVDNCIGKILKEIKKLGGALLITADHGNCDMMLTKDNKPITSHTTNKVPFILYGVENVKLRSEGALCDIAPTILELLNIKQPKEMTGKSLIEK
ncbi:MAG: 2,3-bisphosphoglycerate-independent phosphoglycerate mutase [Peptoniphilus lacrimalis]|uniref:2,3-bisphosphoglycerate-independent phosphoglycerate mutase n=1 Tax=Peptoniphilus lacrimalis TaxID=33031 RepID=UPI00254B2EF1|nr:2,3-bisphosphoglycerate-independent phosphoglycerate mutase [Peptoniphilus lacrimalis]MDK8281197.1 2,3-bisphosphoglycerate-independent phosphoglycerate mutase [Peptoniphilus lacrimalis]